MNKDQTLSIQRLYMKDRHSALMNSGTYLIINNFFRFGCIGFYYLSCVSLILLLTLLSILLIVE